MSAFSERLSEAVRRRRTPAMVGLDPRWDGLPAEFHSAGDSTAIRAAAYRRFCEAVIDEVAPLAPAVKPQAAFFEELGAAGMQVLDDVCRYAQSAGLLVVLDAKRGDIGSTAEAYARAYLAPRESGGWGVDALTVNPYLGVDSLEPFVAAAHAHGRGLFVLVKTSNPRSGDFQDLPVEGQPLYRRVAERVERLAAESAAGARYGSIGAVVGATYPEQLVELRRAMPHAWLLIPGYGAQGGRAADVVAALDAQGEGALVNNARGILSAHQRPDYAGMPWREAVAAATRRMIDELRATTEPPRTSDCR